MSKDQKRSPEKEPLKDLQANEGGEDDQNFIDYRNMKPGDYELHVKPKLSII